MEDSKKNFLHDGSFHLVIYPPTPFRCESFTIKARHFPPVDCSTFKGDTCHIYSEVREWDKGDAKVKQHDDSEALTLL